MRAPPCILLVEDEEHLALGIRENLLLEGYRVELARDGEQALSGWRAGRLALIVLDVMLPKYDGYAVCRRLRAQGELAPILFLTARNAARDRIEGFEAGGDDYLGKPFHLRELLLRVAAMLRRRAVAPLPSRMQTAGCNPNFISLGGHGIDVSGHHVTYACGRRELLPTKEMAILKYLLARQNQVVSRDEILDVVWGPTAYPSSRTVDNFIVRLRRRFEPEPSLPRHFHTIRSVGYRLTIHPSMP